MIISSRTKTIIEFLISAEDYLTIKDIAGRLNLAERTVYREMDNVNDTLGHYSLFVESIKSKGVRLYGSAEDIDHLKKFNDALNYKKGLNISETHQFHSTSNKNKNGEVRKLGRKEKKTTFSWKLAEIKTSICLVGEQIETSN